MKKQLLIIFLFSAFICPASAQTANVDLKALNQYLTKMTKDWDVPSMSVGIVQHGQLIFSESYGVKEVGQTERPDKNSLYAMASNSKAFTSAIIAQLVQESKLDWDGKVKDYLPYFQMYDPWVTAHTTIRDILSHRVGLGTFSGDVIWYKANLSAEQIVKKVQYVPNTFDFRAGYGYSNLMYITAGEVIKAVTGKTWADNVKARILVPLGMNRTITTTNDLEKQGNFATPHARSNNKNIPIKWENWEAVGALGGLISSVEDMSKWMIFNMNHGIQGKDTLLSKASRNMMWTPHTNFTVDHTLPNKHKQHFSAYGLGWQLSDYQGRLRVGHTGGYDGMLTAVNMIPEKKLGVVVFTNGMQSPMMAATYYILDRFLNAPFIDWSVEHLAYIHNPSHKDQRIKQRKEARVTNTKTSLDLNQYVGTYHTDMAGDIIVWLEQDKLRLTFENAPALSATLIHWHYDVYVLDWDQTHAWFSFGTVQFNLTNNLKIKGITFDVPNDDIFFDELKPIRVEN